MVYEIATSKAEPMNHNVYSVVNSETGKVVQSFDELSNDYALTSANELKNKLNGQEVSQ